MTEDIVEILNLIALYGYIIDEREYSRTHELFTADAVYDVSDYNAGIHIGPKAIADLWRGSDDHHPLAHHATNVIVTLEDETRGRVISKGIGVGRNNLAGSATYKDVVVKTPAGWRIAERVAIKRRWEKIPAHS